MKSQYKYLLIIQLLFNIIILIYITNILLNYNVITNEYICQFKVFNSIYIFVIDKSNILFLVLTSIIFPLCTLYIYNNMKFGYKLLSFILFLSEIFLLFSFLTNNLLIFYFFFESLLIPMTILIGFFGSRARRIYAVYLFLFFTLLSSLFIIIGLAIIYDRCGSLCFINILEYNFNNYDKNLILYIFLLGFMSKLPMLPVHLWLPEAHVEASTVGSVLLAALVLKLGFYGLFRIFEVICLFNLPIIFKKVFILMCTNSILLSSLIVIKQIDLKKIVAYSSIIHMNLGILGLCGFSLSGIGGSIFVMFSHGLISAGMFFLVGMLYERFHVRNYMYYGGLIQYMPIFGIFSIIILLANLSIPCTCNFIGEVLVYISIFRNMNIYILSIIVSSSFFTTFFSINLINKIFFYQITGFLTENLKDVNLYEFYILFSLSFFIVLWGIYPNILLNLI